MLFSGVMSSFLGVSSVGRCGAIVSYAAFSIALCAFLATLTVWGISYLTSVRCQGTVTETIQNTVTLSPTTHDNPPVLTTVVTTKPAVCNQLYFLMTRPGVTSISFVMR